MNEQLVKWRKDRTLAHVVPFGVFMVFLLLSQFVGEAMLWEHDNAPWYRHWPEQLFYPIQVVVTLLTLGFFWSHYDFKWSNKVWIGVIAGFVGIAFWLLPTTLYDHWGMTGKPETFFEKLLGLAPRKEGFDPYVFESQWAQTFSLVTRIFRAVVIVSLVEEIFWRGFLMRFLLDRDGKYWKVPFGKPALISFIVVTLAFTIAHAPIDYLGALIYGSLTYGVAVWTKSLLACVVMHGVANASLAAYALAYGKLGLW
ncbi:CAAX prenyl protease-related protein [bacterium]|nr:CAAX prenyl protease-related protein [Akkermansiaceae bacterium]MDB4407175.1 CAAX prenyl protease-related protein [bacterium]MDB4456530.1 CAAX prenyl protease-related protein [bacterium]MDB4562385.1 CAAX prenyl protease-related protein [Akkermansiaceae bacterium]MDB4577553.1 CAAX prenyl protease-related protein [bacterium]